MNAPPAWIVPLATLAAATIAATTTWFVSGWLATRRDKRARAFDLLKQFLTDQHYVRSRIICQKYLQPWGSEKYRLLEGLDFDQINRRLAIARDPEDHEAWFHIRAITSFFWLVHVAHRQRQIPRNTRLFAYLYAYYYVHIIEERAPKGTIDPQYAFFAWMTTKADMEKVRQEKANLAGHVAPVADDAPAPRGGPSREPS